MKRTIPALLVLLLAFMQPLGAEQKSVNVTEVRFSESEPGIEPYTSRLLLGDRFLRLDDGSDEGDFILFDRATGDIHSFNHEDETHLHIEARAATPIDFELDYRVQARVLADAPEIDGQRPVEHRFLANDQLCLVSINVKGLLPQLAEVLLRYEAALVEQSKVTLPMLPAAQKTACYMANNFLHASDYLKVGFPLHVTDYQGRQKKLLSFQQLSKPAALYQFPKGYRQYNPSAPQSVKGGEDLEPARR